MFPGLCEERTVRGCAQIAARKETLLARVSAGKIPPCCKRCMTPAGRRQRRLSGKPASPRFASCCWRGCWMTNSPRFIARGKIHGGVFLGRGQEALSASVGVSLKKGDVFAPLIRDAAGRLAFGESDPRRRADAISAPRSARCAGATATFIAAGRERGYLPMVSHLGAMISVVNGMLFARRLKNISGTVGAACIGDGATSTGSFHEALNQAAVEKLPARPHRRQQPIRLLHADLAPVRLRRPRRQGRWLRRRIADRWMARIWPPVCKVVGEAVARARQGAGPQLVVATLLRLCGHGEHDDADYIDPKLKNSPLGPRLPESRRGISDSGKNGWTPRDWPCCETKSSTKSRKPSPRSSANRRPTRLPRTGGRFRPDI